MEAPRPPTGDVQKLGKVEVESLTIKSKCGRHQITMQGFHGGVGIWVGQTGGTPCCCMVSLDGQGQFLGLHDNSGKACPVAISVAADGNPCIQLSDGARTRHFTVEELLTLAGA